MTMTQELVRLIGGVETATTDKGGHGIPLNLEPSWKLDIQTWKSALFLPCASCGVGRRTSELYRRWAPQSPCLEAASTHAIRIRIARGSRIDDNVFPQRLSVGTGISSCLFLTAVI